MKKTKKNLAVFASGNGSNFEAIVKKIKEGFLPVAKCLLITDKKNAFVRKRAQKYQIKSILLDSVPCKNKEKQSQELIQILESEKIDAVALAGYMRILPASFVKHFKYRIVNIHPSLLPSFAGKKAISRAFNYGVKITGATVHFVSREVDRGPIIAQRVVEIKKGMSLSKLEKEIHKTEHRLYPEILNLLLNQKLKIKNRRVEII